MFILFYLYVFRIVNYFILLPNYALHIFLMFHFWFFTLLKFNIIGFAWEAFDFGSFTFRLNFILSLHIWDLIFDTFV